MTFILFALLFVALTVPGFVLAVRALPPVERLVLAGVKPWACDVCSTFWATLVWGAVAWVVFGHWALVAVPPSYTIALWLLGELSRPATLPPPPDLGPSDGDGA
jgi:hypothetical protein